MSGNTPESEEPCVGMQKTESTKESLEFITKSGVPDYYYLNIVMSFLNNNPKPDSPETFKMVIINNMKTLFGEYGAALPFDILKLNETTSHAIVRVPGNELVRFMAGLTFSSQFMGNECRFEINKVSSSLLSLSKNSRRYMHSIATR